MAEIADAERRFGKGQGHREGWTIDELDREWPGMDRAHVALCCFGNLVAAYRESQAEVRRLRAANTKLGELWKKVRRGQSGCACRFEDDGETLISLCGFHARLIRNAEEGGGAT